jgi:hypothetical protein
MHIRRRKEEIQQKYFLNRRSGEFGYQNSGGGGGYDRSAGYQQETLDPRLEIHSDIVLQHRRRARRRDYFANNDDWRSVGGGGRRSNSSDNGSRFYGGGNGHDVELTDFGLIDLPQTKPRLLSPANQLWRSVNCKNGINKSQLATATTTVQKGLLWVQKDRLFAR